MIEIIDKHTAKLIVNIGSGKTRKRRTKKVTYSGKRELNNLYREFEAECKRAPSSKITVNELVDSYIKHKELLGAKATTIKGYKSAAKRVNSRFAGISAGVTKTLTPSMRSTVTLVPAAMGSPVVLRAVHSMLPSFTWPTAATLSTSAVI